MKYGQFHPLSSVSAEEKRGFARRVHAELAEAFGPKRAARILRAAGPGRAPQAVRWAEYVIGLLNDKAGGVDALDVVLSGAGGSTGFGWDRMVDALLALGIPPPTAGSSTAFFSILSGAREALRGWGGLRPRNDDPLPEDLTPAPEAEYAGIGEIDPDWLVQNYEG